MDKFFFGVCVGGGGGGDAGRVEVSLPFHFSLASHLESLLTGDNLLHCLRNSLFNYSSVLKEGIFFS